MLFGCKDDTEIGPEPCPSGAPGAKLVLVTVAPGNAYCAWVRLRRVLADAERLYVISEVKMQRLIAAGLRAESVGLELEPSIQILVISPEARAPIDDAPEIPVALSAAFLSARRDGRGGGGFAGGCSLVGAGWVAASQPRSMSLGPARPRAEAGQMQRVQAAA